MIDPEMDLDGHPDRLKEVGEILSIISIYEFVKRGVLLSAVVSTNGMPGNGFYKLIQNLGIADPKKDKIWLMCEQIIINKQFWMKDKRYKKFKDDSKGLIELEQLVKSKEVEIAKDLTPHLKRIKQLI